MSYSDEIHALIVEIWGKKRAKKGYNWLYAKYGTMFKIIQNPEAMESVRECLISKRDQTECSVHHRVHEG